jgi:hypothetical protein
VHVLEREIQHLHLARRRDVADGAHLPRREIPLRSWLWRRIHKLQPPPRQIAPAITRELQLHRLRMPDEPNFSSDAPAHAIIDLAANHVLVDAPGHVAQCAPEAPAREPVVFHRPNSAT